MKLVRLRHNLFDNEPATGDLEDPERDDRGYPLPIPTFRSMSEEEASDYRRRARAANKKAWENPDEMSHKDLILQRNEEHEALFQYLEAGDQPFGQPVVTCPCKICFFAHKRAYPPQTR